LAWVEEVKPKRRINSILPSQPQFKPLNSVKPISIKSQGKAVTAVLISIIGSFIIGFPGGGYIYLGNIPRGVIYGFLAWVFSIVLILLYLLGFILSPVFSTIYFPIMFLFFLYDLIVVYDTYLYAKTGAGILP